MSTVAPLPDVLADDPAESAKAAGLRYMFDDRPGIRRIRAGRGYRYRGPDGQNINDPETLARIRSLAIPPAWSEVWICPYEDGHIQATGRDKKGRRQHRYHARWREVRKDTKFEHIIAFGEALPAIRARVAKDLARHGLPREKILAAVVRLLETTLIRVGNEEYVRQNGSYGLTTLRDHHAEIDGAAVRFRFRGKSGVWHNGSVTDRRLARVVRDCQDLPGEELFQYKDESGIPRPINSADVNAYLREITNKDFTAKDFRTWNATVLAAHALQAFEAFDSEAQAKRNLLAAIESVAKRLGNSRSICRKCYVHPAVMESYLDGSLARVLTQRVESELEQSLADLAPEEAAVLAFLRQRLQQESESSAEESLQQADA